MFLSPLVAALLIGSFWTGVGATAAANGAFDHPRDHIRITAEATSHEDACSARYRSYNVDTDQYMSSRDHKWHDCAL